MEESYRVLIEGIPKALYQNIVEACRVCDGYSLEEVLLCPRCIAKGERSELEIRNEIKSGRKELFCSSCRFLCWLRSYLDYRKIAQYFPGWNIKKNMHSTSKHPIY